MKNHSKYLIFVDESGDHLLEAHDSKYPIFVLAFLIIKKSHYCNFLLPKFTKLKLKYFPTDNIIFHEREIRKKIGNFLFLQDPKESQLFMRDLNDLVAQADFKIIISAVRKDGFLESKNQYFAGHTDKQQNPYEVGTTLCINQLSKFLLLKKEIGKKTTITFESRGKKEDNDLKNAFKEINNFKMEMISKSSNSIGLQMADLIARPIGIKLINHLQQNRAYDILENKIYSMQQLWVKR